jgi:hypothetical protein
MRPSRGGRGLFLLPGGEGQDEGEPRRILSHTLFSRLFKPQQAPALESQERHASASASVGPHFLNSCGFCVWPDSQPGCKGMQMGEYLMSAQPFVVYLHPLFRACP